MLSTNLCRARALIAAILFLAALPAAATPSLGSADEWNVVPTFQSLGIYWAPPGGGATVTAQVLFRESGVGGFRPGLDLWYDARNAEYRGSIVELKPNTVYDIKLTLSTGYSVSIFSCAAANRCSQTWSEQFTVPAGWTFTLGAGVMEVDVYAAPVSVPTSSVSGAVQTIRVPNAPTGANYTLLTATAPNNVIDQATYASNGVCVDIAQGVRYFIVRGLVMRNCQQVAVRLVDGGVALPTDHIVVEDNDMSGWGGGTAADPYKAGAFHCAYYNEANDALHPNQIVIQRNKMHDPRYASSMWGLNGGRPNGPVALNFDQCGSNNVIRYNDVYSTDGGNYFSNGFMGTIVQSPDASGLAAARGFPRADSDIYGNRISHVNDDAIYAVSANRNVRIWGNYMDKVAAGINNSTNSVGPLYVWRNVSNQFAAMRYPADPDAEGRGPFVRGGADSTSLNGGRAYYFHNTVLQPPPLPGETQLSGAGFGIRMDGGFALYNFVSQNNIWDIFRTDSYFKSIDTPNLTAAQQQTIVADYDLYNGGLNPAGLGAANAEAHGMPGTPVYASSFALPSASNGWTGDFSLAPNSFGYRAAADIPNFNDIRPRNFLADVGAQQSGMAPAQYGRDALAARLARTPAFGAAPLTVTFDPGASSPAGSIASYSIDFGDGTPAGSGAAPQSHAYAANGTYTAKLTVTGADGRQATDSRLVQVGDGIARPAAYELFVSVDPGLTADASAGEAFNISVQAADSRALGSVRFYVDGVLRSTDTTAPFQWTWTTAPADAGSHVIRAEATDTAGNLAVESRNVTVMSASCAVATGASSIEQGKPLSVEAVCSPYKTVTEVEFYVDGVLLGTDTRAPYTWTVDTSTLTAAAHSIVARGKFSPSGQIDATQSVTVTASTVAIAFNPGPVIRAGETLTLGAKAFDGRPLKQVDFFIDGDYRDGVIAPDTAGSFNLSWTPGAAGIGRHTLLVQATDINNNVLSSTRELFAAANVCGLVLANNGYAAKSNDAVYLLPPRLPLGRRVPVQGVCSAASAITKVEFYRDGVLQATDTGAPYTWTFDTSGLTAGAQYTLTTRAYVGTATFDDSLVVEIVGQ
jgi:PKD repeat protein